jgi:hypothetical protein
MQNWSENKSKYIGSGIVFLLSFLVFFLTMAPTVSFWDCGEFIACAHTLGIPHPPGTPFYVLISRFFIIILPFVGEIAARVNLISVLTSALTVGCCFLIAWESMTIFMDRLKQSIPIRKTVLWVSSFCAASLTCLSDTVWFNAVEAEVYGMAMFMVFIMTWLSLRWYAYRETETGDRLMILIVYIGYLGVGAHLYSLLTIPAIFVFMLLCSPRLRSSRSWPIWITGVLLYSVVYKVDSFLVWAIAVTAVCLIAGFVVKAEEKYAWNLSMWFGIVALIGYSTHAYIPIRSSLNPIIDENNPEIALDDAFSPSEWKAFNDFIGRKQYGSESMISRASHRRADFLNQLLTFPHMGYGGYQIAQYLPFKVGQVRHTGYKTWQVVIQDNEPLQKFGVNFPTQMSSIIGKNKLLQFLIFAFFNGILFWVCFRIYQRDKALGVYLGMLYTICSLGLIFYINFADGTGSEKGQYLNWIQQGRPGQGPPLVHMEVRERDYFFTPAFIMMSILYGMGIGLFLLGLWERGKQQLVKPWAVTALVLTAFIPGYSNWKEHNRTGLYVPWDYAYNLINSCQPNSILFTNGDNDTFPLWFIQEVEGIRKDVRVVNLSLGNTPWYVSQILSQEPKKKLNTISRLPSLDLLRPTGDKQQNIDQAKKLRDRLLQIIPQQMAQIESVTNPKSRDSIILANPGLDIDAAKVKAEQNLVSMKNDLQMFNAMANWGEKTMQRIPYMRVQDQLIIDLVRSNPKTPIHFATTVGSEHYVGLEQYMNMDGMVWTLNRSELKPQGKVRIAETEALVDSVYKFRGLGDSTAYINPETMRLLYNYNSIYIRLALEYRTKILESQTKGEASNVSKYLAKGIKYLSKGMAQFPKEWRNYVVGSELYAIAGQQDKAQAILNKGLANVDDWDAKPIEDQLRKLSQIMPQLAPQVPQAKP